MLAEQLQPYLVFQPDDFDEPARFFLTINKTSVGNTWSACYQDFQTGRTMFGINNCESLDEVAIRLTGRLQRWHKRQLQPPRTLHDLPKGDTVGSANLTEGHTMAEPEQTLTQADLQQRIDETNDQVSKCMALEKSAKPPVVQEVVLARRHLEDAADRFQRALDLVKASTAGSNKLPETTGTDTDDPLNQKQPGTPAAGSTTGDDTTTGNNAQ